MKHTALRCTVAALAVAGAVVSGSGSAAADIALAPADPAAATVADEPSYSGSTNVPLLNSLSSGVSSLVPPKLLPDLVNSGSGQVLYPPVRDAVILPLYCAVVTLSGTPNCGMGAGPLPGR
ncbi:hypothetical protein [Nocardia sp. NPDC057668]|uniref:hypothetical protein n=1 Tax=Nocardia sp. NPDC057668 TaxID=3346202 RepID=UPI00366F1CF6